MCWILLNRNSLFRVVHIVPKSPSSRSTWNFWEKRGEGRRTSNIKFYLRIFISFENTNKKNFQYNCILYIHRHCKYNCPRCDSRWIPDDKIRHRISIYRVSRPNSIIYNNIVDKEDYNANLTMIPGTRKRSLIILIVNRIDTGWCRYMSLAIWQQTMQQNGD